MSSRKNSQKKLKKKNHSSKKKRNRTSSTSGKYKINHSSLNMELDETDDGKSVQFKTEGYSKILKRLSIKRESSIDESPKNNFSGRVVRAKSSKHRARERMSLRQSSEVAVSRKRVSTGREKDKEKEGDISDGEKSMRKRSRSFLDKRDENSVKYDTSELALRLWDILEVPELSRNDIVYRIEKLNRKKKKADKIIRSHTDKITNLEQENALQRDRYEEIIQQLKVQLDIARSDRINEIKQLKEEFKEKQLADSEKSQSAINDLRKANDALQEQITLLNLPFVLHNEVYQRFNLKTPSGKPIPRAIDSEIWSEEILLQFIDYYAMHRFGSFFSTKLANRLKKSNQIKYELDIFELNDKKPSLILVEATIDQLVELLVIPKSSPIKKFFNYPKFLTNFLNIYPLFINEMDLLERLLTKYKAMSHDLSGFDLQVKESILNVIYEWVHLDKGRDFMVNNFSLKSELGNFLADLEDELGVMQKKIRKQVKLIKNERNSTNQGSSVIYTSSSSISKKVPRFSEFQPRELAEQLTIIDFELFKLIDKSEYYYSEWSSKKTEYQVPNVMRSILYGNRLGWLVITEILKEGTFKARSAKIVFFINVMMHLEEMNSYNSLYQILGALHNISISKLRRSWDIIPKKEKDIFDRMTSLLSSLGHYKNYFREIHTIPSNAACIPILSIAFEDIQKLNEIVRSFNEDKINWDKLSRLSEIILRLNRFSGVYEYRPVKGVIESFHRSEIWDDENVCWEIAKIKDSTLVEMGTSNTEDLWAETSLSNRDWKFILTGAETTFYSPGEIILDIGVPNDKLYRIKRGTVKVQKEIDGNRVTLVSLGEGDIFGEMSLVIPNGTTTAIIIADDEVEIDSIQIDFVLDICRQEPRISSTLNFVLALKLADRLKEMHGGKGSSRKRKVSKTVAALGKKKKKKETADSKFEKLFGIKGEVVVRYEHCTLRSGSTSTGILYVTQQFLGFSANNFGFKVREVIPFDEVTSVTKRKNKLEIEQGIKIFKFHNVDDIGDISQIIRNIWKAQSKGLPGRKKTLTSSEEDPRKYSVTSVGLHPVKEDWQLILRGARIVTLNKDEEVIKEGSVKRRLYQVIKGGCYITKQGVEDPIGYVGPTDGVFGEISFLQGAEASASVRAAEDKTSVHIIEAYYVNILFQYFPELAGRFYHYLASILSSRITARENTKKTDSTSVSLTSQTTTITSEYVDSISYDADESA
eukprot:TRINITY_DN5429_c0_g1_i1.p1 TRINITY_DN5429_c0_g1~~TRINITY_DN5429_c0_g1_i1.p1  ORF type:complete len:1213 (+),score=278.52 TRINITY_DN5429_c0_g1_i1:32-3670(+)